MFAKFSVHCVVFVFVLVREFRISHTYKSNVFIATNFIHVKHPMFANFNFKTFCKLMDDTTYYVPRAQAYFGSGIYLKISTFCHVFLACLIFSALLYTLSRSVICMILMYS